MEQFIVLTFFLLLSSTGILSNKDDDIKTEMFNIHKGIAIAHKKITKSEVTREEITFHMYRKYSEPKEAIINETNFEIIRDAKGSIVFITHGWTSNGNDQWILELKDTFLDIYPNFTVITVDWKEPANQLYYVASINVYDVGNIIADAIAGMVENNGLHIEQFILIGYSLGGQTSGFAGKRLQKLGHKLSRIIALDPAGPLFEERPADKRLNPTDAKVVEVIHSDRGGFGFIAACGTIDFFPNGGQFQPGCSSSPDPVFCDHQRSHRYFTEAIRNPKNYLVATRCSEWNFLRKVCDPNVTVALGDLTTTLTGKFYLETNKEKPYNKKEPKEATGLLDRVGKVSNLFSEQLKEIFEK